MPTFKVVKGGKEVGEAGTLRNHIHQRELISTMQNQMMGANPAGLSSLIKQHAGSPPAANSEASGSGSSSSEPGVVCILHCDPQSSSNLLISYFSPLYCQKCTPLNLPV
jgi:hypothetical protein